MASAIEGLWKQALKTFTGCQSDSFRLCLKNFEKLRSLINEITAEDVGVDEKVLDYVCIQSAPMCVIDVFENEDITIAVFLLKNGVTLPMHDHPEMHGLLKVISGAVKIDSYSIDSNSDCNIEERKLIPATKHPSITVKETDPACVLTPLVRNIHEVTCIEGPAAFLDILSPPYDTCLFREARRPCRFFKVASGSEAADKVQLVLSDAPPTFYSRNIKYRGQPLSTSQGGTSSEAASIETRSND